jgi:hypothetical protein
LALTAGESVVSEARDGDWRLTVRFQSDRQRAALWARLSERTAAATAENRVKELVSARREGPWLRLYASSYESLSRAQAAISSTLAEADVNAEERPERFDQRSGQWTVVDAPLVSEIEAQRITMYHGHGPWGADTEKTRVTIQLQFEHRSDALDAAQRLIATGYDAHRHWTTVYLFADDRPPLENWSSNSPRTSARRPRCSSPATGRAPSSSKAVTAR